MCSIAPTALSLTAMMALGAYALWAVARSYRAGAPLGLATAVAVWLLYGMHAVLTLWFAWCGTWRVPAPWPIVAVATICSVAGLVLIGAAMYEFRSLQRISGRRPDCLITSGVYRFSRNPQNLGWTLFLTGAAVTGGSLAALLMAGGAWITFHVYVVAMEEPFLERVHGRLFQRYCEATPRYLGRRRLAQPDSDTTRERDTP